MDVALDSNEFLSDPRMEGVRFQTLLSYLRKTQSDLLIPRIVLDEVIARYPERISEPHNKAANAVRLLRSLLLAAKIPAIPELKVDREIAAMKRKLKKPSPHVQSVVLTNFGDVSVQEVARRGIERIPPANAKGEELRDVMIWLMVLRHAEKAGEDVAFISNDEHSREGGELHPKLRDDLHEGRIKLHFYKAIDDFIYVDCSRLVLLTHFESPVHSGWLHWALILLRGAAPSTTDSSAPNLFFLCEGRALVRILGL